jgi:hypothetical protein
LGIVRRIICGFSCDCNGGRMRIGDGMGFIADFEEAAIGDAFSGAF